MFTYFFFAWQWLCDEGLMELLAAKFEVAGDPTEEQLCTIGCVADTLKEIITSQPSSSPVISYLFNGRASFIMTEIAFGDVRQTTFKHIFFLSELQKILLYYD